MTRRLFGVVGLLMAAGCSQHSPLSQMEKGSGENESPPRGSGDDAGSTPGNGDDGGVTARDDAGTVSSGETRFISRVVSFEPGPGAGHGESRLAPGGSLYGPPHGTGDDYGSLDVTSLGNAGSIVLELGNFIVDGPGVDFIVFENPFFVDHNPEYPFAEPAKVSVSEDGVTWYDFPCTAMSFPYGRCAGWNPVYSNPDNGISPFDPRAAGGDPFDLEEVGVARAKFVKIVDMNSRRSAAPFAGFDIDSIAIVHPENPAVRP